MLDKQRKRDKAQRVLAARSMLRRRSIPGSDGASRGGKKLAQVHYTDQMTELRGIGWYFIVHATLFNSPAVPRDPPTVCNANGWASEKWSIVRTNSSIALRFELRKNDWWFTLYSSIVRWFQAARPGTLHRWNGLSFEIMAGGPRCTR